MKSIGEQCRDFRMWKGWNTTRMASEVQKSASDSVVVSRQKIEQLEAVGHRRPRYMAALAKTMGISMEDLEAGLWVKPTGATAVVQVPTAAPEAHPVSSEAAHLLAKLGSQLSALGKTDREIALLLLRDLADSPESFATVAEKWSVLLGGAGNAPVKHPRMSNGE